MTREEAIKHLGILRVFDAPDLNEAIKMAIAALREQEGKEPCEWCLHFNRSPMSRIYLLSEGNGMYKEAMFGFCPMCGRRLEEV